MSDATAPDPGGAAPISGGTDGVGSTTGPPVAILGGAALCVLVGVVLLVPGTFAAHVAGYVASPLVAILLVGLFRRVDLRRRLAPAYRPAPTVARAIPVILVVAFVVAALHVWAIATEVAS